MGSATYKNGGGAQVTTDNIQYILYTGAEPGFWFEWGTSEKYFIHEFLSSSVLQWRRQNFDSGDIHTNVLIKDILKNFEKI